MTKPIASVTPISAAPSAGKQIVSVKSDIEAAIPRDRWDRPLIIPREGGAPIPYSRASSVSEVLEDHYGLQVWEKRLAAEGFARRPDLVLSIHGASKKEIDAIVEEAMDQAGRNVASRNGTTMHGFTEKVDKGIDLPSSLPVHIEAMIEKYMEVFAKRFEVLETERFVVQDTVKVAGTYDKLVRDRQTGLILIGDTKTGQRLNYLGLKTCAQVAVYAAGDHYDLDGEREPHGADRDRGLLIHLPWTEDPREAHCEIRWLDLRIGRQAIKEAQRVKSFRALTANQMMPLVHD